MPGNLRCQWFPVESFATPRYNNAVFIFSFTVTSKKKKATLSSGFFLFRYILSIDTIQKRGYTLGIP